MEFKGIILAGGFGTRLYPNTVSVSKQLLPVYDKPMIYYSFSILMLSGIRDILLICNEENLSNYMTLFGDGDKFGVNVTYKIQDRPRGIADAFILGKDFIGNDGVCLVLGDNLFYGQDFTAKLLEAKKMKQGANIFAKVVQNPRDFGVVEVNRDNIAVSIQEKPPKPRSNLAVTGLYFYDNQVIDIAKDITPSPRGELEISDINDYYLKKNQLKVNILGRGFTWLDTGSSHSLLEAAQFVRTIESLQGFKIACLEEIAFHNGWISEDQLIMQVNSYPPSPSEYQSYIIDFAKRLGLK